MAKGKKTKKDKMIKALVALIDKVLGMFKLPPFLLPVLGFGALVSVLAVLAFLASRGDVAVLSPAGTIGQQQRDLIIFTAALSLIVIIPVYLLTFGIVLRYREGNKRSKYSPDLHGNRVAETVWWGIPILLITILGTVMWKTSHSLDPFRPLASSTKPVTIQVVALQWKWLFIYPEQNIATVNYVRIPEDTPINFKITSDAPMNSFWIPKLGGQIYAMAGMETQLHLQAGKVGKYQGSSANISGEGFAGMRFVAEATTKADYDKWLGWMQDSSAKLTMDEYNKLAKPSTNNPPASYSNVHSGLYDTVIMKYMMPLGSGDEHGATHNQEAAGVY